MALLPQNPRDQKLLIIAVLAVGLAAVYQQLVWTPKNNDLNSVAVRLDTLDSLNRLAKIEVAKGTATRLESEANAYSRELSVLRGLVPTANEVPGLLESVSSAARRAGLELGDIQPEPPVNGDQYDTYRYKLGVTGPYHRMAEFLTNVGTLPRIVATINLTLAPSARVGEMKQKKNEQLLDAHFQIQTYVAHTAPKAGGAGAP
jgi:type IV pilus assembly protein PilO